MNPDDDGPRMRMKMTLPDLDDDCAGCSHPFALHYITHNGMLQGCLTPPARPTATKGVTEHSGKCDCRGFSVGWSPEVTLPYAPQQPVYPPDASVFTPQQPAYEPPTVEWERQP